MITLLQEGEAEMAEEIENCSEDKMGVENPSSRMRITQPGKQRAKAN